MVDLEVDDIAAMTQESRASVGVSGDSIGYRQLYRRVLLVFLSALFLGGLVVFWVDRGETERHKQEAIAAASVHGHLLQQQLAHSLSATHALAAVLRQGNGRVDDFEALAGEMLKMFGGLSSLQLAPNGVIRHIVPQSGNEAALGHNLLEDPERNRESFLALKSRTLTLAGPFELRQGGQAVVGRLPVFLDVGKRGEHFWGFATAVIRIPDLIQSSALDRDYSQGYQFTLSRIHPDSGLLQTIWRSTTTSGGDPVSIRIAVPNGAWTLSVLREGGWHMSPPALIWLCFAVLLFSSMFALLTYYLLRQPLQLSKEIEVRTAALNEANESLKVEIFEHWQTELALREGERRLERRVQERTHELELANDALKSEQIQQKLLIDKLADTRSQLLQAEMMAAVGQLAAGVAHEINNPLGYIVSNTGTVKGYSESILDGLYRYRQLLSPYVSENEDLREALALIDQDVDLPFIREDLPPLIQDTLDGLSRVKQIVQDLREFSFVDKEDWQLVDLNNCLKSSLSIMTNDFGGRIKVSLALGEIPMVECNGPQINQVFRNLLLNAVQVIEGEGEITVTTRKAGAWVDVEIRDTGHGISPENLSRVFEPFFTTRGVGRGSGLGLSVAYHILKSHGGSISVESEPSMGARFTVRFPLVQRNAAVDTEKT